VETLLEAIVKNPGWTPDGVGIWVVAMMIAGWMLKEWREYRKLSIEDRNARRDGYARQVEILLGENRALMEDQRKLREEYDHHRKICQAETDQLRDMIVNLEGELQGLKRRVATDAVEIMRLKGNEI
jgi:predicted RNase H-like nuclease (RuvC/YqgF family)